MQSIRTTLVATLLLSLVPSLSLAQDAKFRPKKPAPKTGLKTAGPRFDPAKLIGVWMMEEETSVLCEFTKDGVHHVFTTTKEGQKIGAKGKYTVEGDQLLMTAELDGKPVTEACQIKTLNDEVLIYQLPEEKTPTKLIKRKAAVVSKPIEPKAK
jgi:uncharacterized protein (TIGR03066 family)